MSEIITCISLFLFEIPSRVRVLTRLTSEVNITEEAVKADPN